MQLYHTLPTGSWTRLVVVHPAFRFGVYQEDITAHLRVVSLAEAAGTYTAISYVFGDPAKTRSITVSGEVMPITENAYEAIKRFRLPDRPVQLWNDLI